MRPINSVRPTAQTTPFRKEPHQRSDVPRLHNSSNGTSKGPMYLTPSNPSICFVNFQRKSDEITEATVTKINSSLTAAHESKDNALQNIVSRLARLENTNNGVKSILKGHQPHSNENRYGPNSNKKSEKSSVQHSLKDKNFRDDKDVKDGGILPPIAQQMSISQRNNSKSPHRSRSPKYPNSQGTSGPKHLPLS